MFQTASIYNWILRSLLVISLLGCQGGTQRFSLMPEQDNIASNLEMNEEVDVLWIIDNSTSMQKHQDALAAQVSHFINAMDETKLDYRMAFITTDMRDKNLSRGQFIGNPSVLYAGMPDLIQETENRISGIGELGSTVERGLDAMKLSLSPEFLSTVNKGFFREQSLLVVIILSDENDLASAEIDYVAFLDELKPPLPSGERSWVSHFLGVIPDDPSCTTYLGFSSYGYRYMELVEASGGVNASICTADLGQALTAVKARVIEFVTDFRLDRIPLIESIRVYIDGIKIPQDSENGWSYVEQTNAIRFHGNAVPTSDAKVRIDYDPVNVKE